MTLILEYNLENVPIQLENIDAIRIEFPKHRMVSWIVSTIRRLGRRRRADYWVGVEAKQGQSEDDAMRDWITDHQPDIQAEIDHLSKAPEVAYELALTKGRAQVYTGGAG